MLWLWQARVHCHIQVAHECLLCPIPLSTSCVPSPFPPHTLPSCLFDEGIGALHGNSSSSPPMCAYLAYNQHVEGILPKGPYLPCVSMADRALMAGYRRCDHAHTPPTHIRMKPMHNLIRYRPYAHLHTTLPLSVICPQDHCVHRSLITLHTSFCPIY